MRGTGGSTGTVAGCTFASLADDVDQVRAAIGLDRAIVMGHSNHGCIALEHALRHPEHCAATLSVASGPDFSHTFSTGQARWDLEASAEQKAALARRQAEFEAIDKRGLNADETSIRNYQAVAPLVFRDLNVDAKSLWGEIPRGAGEYMQRVIIQQGAEWNLVPELPKIAAPVLAICGRYDYVCPVELWGQSSIVCRRDVSRFSSTARITRNTGAIVSIRPCLSSPQHSDAGRKTPMVKFDHMGLPVRDPKASWIGTSGIWAFRSVRGAGRNTIAIKDDADLRFLYRPMVKSRA